MIDMAQLIEPAATLDDLDTPFGLDEIWNAIKRLRARKAPGPDGFTAEIVHTCWNMVNHDFVVVFQQIFNLSCRGFSKPSSHDFVAETYRCQQPG
jgi:hypothetical protein